MRVKSMAKYSFKVIFYDFENENIHFKQNFLKTIHPFLLFCCIDIKRS